MLKVFKWASLSLLALVMLIVLVGVYRFNFTDNDIYVENERGDLVRIDTLDQ